MEGSGLSPNLHIRSDELVTLHIVCSPICVEFVALHLIHVGGYRRLPVIS